MAFTPQEETQLRALLADSLDKKISQLSAQGTAKDTDTFVIVDGAVNKKAPFSIYKTNIYDNLPSLENYETGWKLNLLNGGVSAEWRNVHLGDDNTDPTDTITHNLGVNLGRLLVKILISTDGTEANSFEVDFVTVSNTNYGITINYVDDNNIKIQTGSNGYLYLTDSGLSTAISTTAWYYKVVVVKLY